MRTAKNSTEKTAEVYQVNHVHFKSLQLCSTLCDPMDCSPPGSSAHGILQVRIMDWVAMPFSRESSQPRDRTHISCLLHWQVGSLPLAPPGKPKYSILYIIFKCSSQFIISIITELFQLFVSIISNQFNYHSFTVQSRHHAQLIYMTSFNKNNPIKQIALFLYKHNKKNGKSVQSKGK